MDWTCLKRFANVFRPCDHRFRRGQELDKIKGLDAGADDYLTKPFGVPELMPVSG